MTDRCRCAGVFIPLASAVCMVQVGTFGDVAAMSVMSGKSLAVGEGGMLVCSARPSLHISLPVLALCLLSSLGLITHGLRLFRVRTGHE
jgi:hypothetical protein